VTAIFTGPNDEYRVRLERDVDGLFGTTTAALIGVNPSTADATANDQTIRKDMGFARLHGWRRIIKGNKFGFRATDVRELAQAADPIGPETDLYLEQIIRDADIVVACWGRLGKLPARLRDRWRDVAAIADNVGKPLYCLGTADDGHPLHTLTLPYSARLQLWNPPA